MANFYWTSPAAGRIARSAPLIGLGVGRRLSALLRALEYSRLVSALDRLPDTHLNKVGLRRSDIPEHARRLVYGGN